MDRRKLWSLGGGGGIFQAVNTKLGRGIQIADPGDWRGGTYSFQVMNFRAGVVSIKIAVLRRERGEMKNLMVASITPSVISI